MHIGNVQSSMASIMNSDYVEQIGSFSMSHQSTKTLVLDLGDLYAVESCQALEREDIVEFEEINKSIARVFVRLVHGIFILSPERDSSNRFTTDMPPCQPHSVATMGAFAFTNIVREQVHRIQHSFEASYVYELTAEFKFFEEQYHSERGFKSIVDNTNDRTKSFQDNWVSFQSSFPKLVEFCGGLASVFTGTSTVKSDFSLIGWEKDEYQFCLTDLSLEGILHSKQSETLAQIETFVDKSE